MQFEERGGGSNDTNEGGMTTWNGHHPYLSADRIEIPSLSLYLGPPEDDAPLQEPESSVSKTTKSQIMMSNSTTVSSNLKRMVFLTCAIVLLTLCITTQAQNYHFSNGWHPGGKRSGGISDIQCHFRPQTKALIEKILDEEITRILTTCTSTMNDIAELQ